MEGSSHVLIKTIEELEFVFSQIPAKAVVSLDTETTGLLSSSKLVGFSFAYDSKAYYCPLRHKVGKNLPLEETVILLSDFVSRVRVIFHNAKFDLMILDNEDVAVPNFEDTYILSVMEDVEGEHGLKELTKIKLGREPLTLKEVIGKGSFDDLDPEGVATKYAADDALNTLDLFELLKPQIEKNKFIYRLEKELIWPLIRMARQRIYVDLSYLRGLKEELEKRISLLKDLIYSYSSVQFDLNSPKQLQSFLFNELHLTPVKTTKTGFSTDAEALVRMEGQHPAVKLVNVYRKYVKELSSYVEKLIENSFKDESTGEAWGFVDHHALLAPTGRLSSPGLKESFGINIQSIPSDKKVLYLDCEVVEDASCVREELECCERHETYPWIFNKYGYGTYFGRVVRYLLEGSKKVAIKVFADSAPVRRGFIPPKGFKWLSVDYSGEELRVAANLSKDPAMMKAFLEGRNFHDETVWNVWGVRKGNPEFDRLRGLAKILAFSTIYGGCLGGDSCVQTDRGYEKIKGLVDRDKLKVYTGFDLRDGRAYCSGTKLVKRLTFDDRSYLDVTEDHGVFVLRGGKICSVPVSDILPGEKLLVGSFSKTLEKSYTWSSRECLDIRQFKWTKHLSYSGNSADLWWAVGLLVSDGCFKFGVSADGRRVLRGVNWLLLKEDGVWIEKLVGFLNSLGFEVTARDKRLKNGRTVPLVIVSAGIAFARFLVECLKINLLKDTPEEIWTESEENIAAYISGFFHGDCTRDGRLMITQNNVVGYRRIRDLQLLLRQIGISSVYYKHPGLDRDSHQLMVTDSKRFKEICEFPWAAGKQQFGMRENVDVGSRRDLYSRIKKSEKWSKMPVEEKKRCGVYKLTNDFSLKISRFLDLERAFGIESEVGRTLRRFGLLTLDRVEDVGFEEVYDIEVLEGSHKSFLANGVLVHNSARTLQGQLNITLPEAETVFNSYKQAYKQYFLWHDVSAARAKKTGYIETYFGRRRDLRKFFNSEDKDWRKRRELEGYAYRTCANHQVQGSSSDVMKLTMIRMDRYIQSSGLQDLLKMVISLHDEIDFFVSERLSVEEVKKVASLMRFVYKDWAIPLEVEASVSVEPHSWGTLKKFSLVDSKSEECPLMNFSKILTSESVDLLKKAQAESSGSESIKIKLAGSQDVLTVRDVNLEKFKRSLTLYGVV